MNAKTLLGILCVATGSSLQAQAQTVLTNGLVAYFSLNGNANDDTGNGYNLINYGATLCPDRFGDPNEAYSFDGSTYLASTNVPLTNIVNSTITAWIQLASLNQGPGYAVLLGENAGANNGYGFGVGGGSGSGNALIAMYPGIDFSPAGYVFTSTNQWYQVVMSLASGVATLYVNGVATTNTFNTPTPPPSEISVGGGGGGNPPVFFDGSIDDVRIYNRALSSNEVLQLYSYESQAQPCSGNPAVAIPVVDHGFIVSAAILDGGCGYTNTPLVLIEGGGGTGAAATAVASNGAIVGITITSAGFGYTSAPTIYFYYTTSITTQPQSMVVDAADNATFRVVADDTSALPFNYQWSFDGTNIAGATLSDLIISNVAQTNLGSYSVLVSNAFGAAVSSNAVLSMYPFLVVPFGGFVTNTGEGAILNVQAWGTGPLSYQWYDNGGAISGATNPVFDIANIQFTNAGLYTVVVSNPFGSVTNLPEQVVVNFASVSLGLSPTLTVSGMTGYTYPIQSTTNLADTNSWVTLTNLTLTQPVQLWVDTNTDASLPANPLRFYRILPPQ